VLLQDVLQGEGEGLVLRTAVLKSSNSVVATTDHLTKLELGQADPGASRAALSGGDHDFA
jgi:hypothetical protein